MRLLPPGAPILTAAAMRAAEAASGVAEAELMQRAGLGVAQEVARLAAGRAVLVLAGPGKNGSDARIAAERLRAWGHDVIVADLANIGRATPRPVLLDGLFGTGLSRPLHCTAELGRLAEAAELVIALDLPSGLDTDTGLSMGAARADVTVALGALKPRMCSAMVWGCAGTSCCTTSAFPLRRSGARSPGQSSPRRPRTHISLPAA